MSWNDLSGFMSTMGNIGLGIATGGASAGGSLLGSIAGNVAGNLINSAIGAHFQSNAIDKQLKAQKDLFAYENMNKHQFEVQDLRAAGLNPILSATNGSAVGVGGVGISNPISSDNPFSSAKQMELVKSQQSIEKQNANTNSLVGVSTAKKNYSDSLLAEANTNSAVKSLSWMDKINNAKISNDKLVADSEAAKNYAIGSAAMIQASAVASEHYQNVEESRERSKGYEGQRQEVKHRTHGYNLANWEKQHYLDVRYGNQSAASALDFWNLVHGK